MKKKKWDGSYIAQTCLTGFLVISTYSINLSWSAGKRPGGYVPSCDSAGSGCVGTTLLDELTPDPLAGCEMGQISVLGFTASGRREQKCIDLGECGASSNSLTWGVCRIYSGGKIRYKCLKFNASCP